MNEKLEQEFNNFIDRIAIKESLAEGVPPSMFDLQRVAEHFYNLALADVREMITRQQKANHTGTDEWIRAKSIAYESICDFIDNLTK